MNNLRILLIATALTISWCFESFADDQPEPIRFYSYTGEWLRQFNDPSAKQISLILRTNRFCSMTNLLQLAREVQTSEFRQSVTFVQTADSNALRMLKFQACPVTNGSSVWLTFVVLSNQLPPHVVKFFEDGARHYVKLRENGFSAGYAMASLQWQSTNGLDVTTRDQIKRKFRIPEQWIVRSRTNDQKVVVADGNVAWQYRLNGPSLRIDAKEVDPKFGPLIREALSEASKKLSSSSGAHVPIWAIWGEAQRILQERHNIRWETPHELNFGVWFD